MNSKDGSGGFNGFSMLAYNGPSFVSLAAHRGGWAVMSDWKAAASAVKAGKDRWDSRRLIGFGPGRAS